MKRIFSVSLALTKQNFHNKLRCDFFYTRSYSGKEIDLVIRSGPDIIAIEIKSTRTFNRELIEDLKFYDNSFTRKILIWGGDESFMVENVEVISWRDMSKKVFSKS